MVQATSLSYCLSSLGCVSSLFHLEKLGAEVEICRLNISCDREVRVIGFALCGMTCVCLSQNQVNKISMCPHSKNKITLSCHQSFQVIMHMNPLPQGN